MTERSDFVSLACPNTENTAGKQPNLHVGPKIRFAEQDLKNNPRADYGQVEMKI
jgi:hypothetical protein